MTTKKPDDCNQMTAAVKREAQDTNTTDPAKEAFDALLRLHVDHGSDVVVFTHTKAVDGKHNFRYWGTPGAGKELLCDSPMGSVVKEAWQVHMGHIQGILTLKKTNTT